MQPKTLSDFTGDYVITGDEAQYVHCPVCGSSGKNTYVNMRTGKWMCFGRNHGSGGKVELQHGPEDAARVIREMLAAVGARREAASWPEKGLPAYWSLSIMGQNYLRRRGLSVAEIHARTIVEMESERRVLVPYYGPAGTIIHWNARAYLDKDHGPKYLGAPGACPLYMLPRWEQVDELILVEGMFDAMAVYHATGLPVAAIGGKTLSKRNRRDVLSLARERVDVMLDGDAMGAMVKLCMDLSDERECGFVQVPPNVDPADMFADELRELLGVV